MPGDSEDGAALRFKGGRRNHGLSPLSGGETDIPTAWSLFFA